jgi:hypothetical protein
MYAEKGETGQRKELKRIEGEPVHMFHCRFQVSTSSESETQTFELELLLGSKVSARLPLSHMCNHSDSRDRSHEHGAVPFRA